MIMKQQSTSWTAQQICLQPVEQIRTNEVMIQGSMWNDQVVLQSLVFFFPAITATAMTRPGATHLAMPPMLSTFRSTPKNMSCLEKNGWCETLHKCFDCEGIDKEWNDLDWFGTNNSKRLICFNGDVQSDHSEMLEKMMPSVPWSKHGIWMCICSHVLLSSVPSKKTRNPG